MATSKPVAAKTNDEAQIRQLNEDWRSALANRDLDKLSQRYSPDVLYFDAVPPYQHRGVAAYRRTWEQMFPHRPPRISVEQRNLEITASGDLAVSHCLTRLVNDPRTRLGPRRSHDRKGRRHARAVTES
jgi:ketosteroid isomerase-like protein